MSAEITPEKIAELRRRVEAGGLNNAWRLSEYLAVLDALESFCAEVKRLREEARRSDAGRVEVPRWEDVDAKFQAGEPLNPLEDFVYSNEPAIDDKNGDCADEVFRTELKAALDWVASRLSPSPQPSADVVERPGKAIPDGVTCGHPGCLHHVSHPCEGCGRVAGRSSTNHDAQEVIDCGIGTYADVVKHLAANPGYSLPKAQSVAEMCDQRNAQDAGEGR